MKTNKKLRRTNKGFSLVEAVIAAVIMAVLSIAAVKLYNGYVKDARQQTVDNLAEAAAAAANAYWRKTGGSTPTAAQLNFQYDQTKFQMTIYSCHITIKYLPNGPTSKNANYN